ncbi:TolC family protein [Bythopirellula polymerisocia]|uniref:Outer membrane efflux protein n=1 Tax=Bythopirellula polymerisocia TaxID=2528003 RepID=A0A5C6CVX1_9BACT|nr:TolC family protein [Bythopirellula polymerisocia]TWU28588.1 Outer membrane efflux protein [Bythopirellula polymerisocia]
MNRQIRATLSLGLCVLTLLPGCHPTQPYFFAEDGKVFGTGDLSHYLDVATELEYPDVDACPIDEVTGTQAPLTLSNSENFDIWELTLEDVTRITLTNSKVMRSLGGRITDSGSNIALSTPEILVQNAANALTVYDPAIVETGNGTGTGSPFSGTGVEAALSEFDATLDSSITWNKNDRPQNFGVANLPGFFAPLFKQDLGTGTLGITKNTANGSTFSFRNNYFYDQNNNGSRIQPSDWFTNFEASFNQPFLQGAGTQYNRIAGFNSFQQAAAGGANQIDGVIISRIRQDVALVDFEEGVRDMMLEVEDVYWELYFAYRDLDARKIGRDSALETWRKVQALKGVGTQGGEADKEAQARSQFFRFQAQVQAALTNLYRVENRLRYKMGLTPTDNRLIRPADEPTIAKIEFDWNTVLCEALARRAELRNQKWQIKRRELELVATKNNLMPRLDATGTYRWLGAGDELLDSQSVGGPIFGDGSNAFDVLTSGRFQEWQLGLQFTMPIGFRRALAGVRHHQLLLARERAVLEDLELTVAHQLTDAIRDLDFNFQNTQTNFNSRVASQDEVNALRTVYEAGRERIDLLLDAQRRQAEAESAYYRSLVDYNRAIMRVHYRKGSLLEYNSVYLAEGPWPGKAYFDALRLARQRDASTFINYGYTRPRVISQGPTEQHAGQFQSIDGKNFEVIESPTLAPEQEGVQGEESMPLPEPIDPAGGVIEPLESGVDLAMFPTTEDGLGTKFTPLPTEVPSTPLAPVGYTNSVPEGSEILSMPPSTAPAANPFRNPNRQEFTQWIDSNTRGLPPSEPIDNPFRLESSGTANSVVSP